MRRRLVAAALGAALIGGFAGVEPAVATHCASPAPPCANPVTVALIEGIGYVCSEAQTRGGHAGDKVGNNNQITVTATCSYSNDPLSAGAPQQSDGLTWPGRGKPAVGPFSFVAGPAPSPPGSLCVSSVEGSGCIFDSYGMLYPGNESGLGAYCGSSEGIGRSTFTSANDGLITVADFGWSQSAATILPLTGRVRSTQPAGGVNATVLGFTSSRGTEGGGNCNINAFTTGFNVEGMIVTY